MKIEFNLDNNYLLFPNNTIEIPTMTIVVSAVFHEVTNIIYKFFETNSFIKYKNGK